MICLLIIIIIGVLLSSQEYIAWCCVFTEQNFFIQKWPKHVILAIKKKRVNCKKVHNIYRSMTRIVNSCVLQGKCMILCDLRFLLKAPAEGNFIGQSLCLVGKA